MSDEQPEKLSRRAQRRQAREAGAAAPEGTDPAASEHDATASATEEANGGGDTAAASATEEVREENRRARRAAAAKRRAKRERERDRALEVGLDASELVDDAVARGTDRAVKWVKAHFNVLQWIIVLGVGGWIAYEIYAYRQGKAEARSTDQLMDAILAERGKIGTPGDEGTTDVRGYTDARRVFASIEARQKAAKEAYKAAETMRPGKPIDTLADLGLAGLAYDEGRYGDAKSLYESVRNSELAKTDLDVRGRATEGVALCLEAQEKTDAAIKTYKELESEEIEGFVNLARYSQARLLHSKKNDAAAVALLKKVVAATKDQVKPDEPPGYVAQAARDLLEALDPAALAAEKESAQKDAVSKALEQLQKAAPPASATP